MTIPDLNTTTVRVLDLFSLAGLLVGLFALYRAAAAGRLSGVLVMAGACLVCLSTWLPVLNTPAIVCLVIGTACSFLSIRRPAA